MQKLIPIIQQSDIPDEYRDTPIGELLEYHNLKKAFRGYAQAAMLLGMCMDNRKSIRIPENFAFILRSGGANMRFSEFKVSYAIAVGGVKAIALIGHTNCAMVNLVQRKSLFIEGLVNNAGWNKKEAETYFDNLAPLHEIKNEISFVAEEVKRLRKIYPKILIAPMLYKVEDNLLYLIKE